jgi:hypothetical protein
VLVDGSSIHPAKPLDGFTLVNVSGTCKKGITLANIKNAKLKDLNVTGYAGPLVSTYNVSGTGVDGAAAIDPPKVPEAIVAPAEKFKLH